MTKIVAARGKQTRPRHALEVVVAAMADQVERAAPNLSDAELEAVRAQLQRAHDAAAGELVRRAAP